MEDIYLYDKEKDEALEAIALKIASLPTDGDRIEYIKTISPETRGELISYMKWETAKAKSSKMQAEAKAEALRERNAKIRADNERLKREISETLKILEAMDNPSIFSYIGEA